MLKKRRKFRVYDSGKVSKSSWQTQQQNKSSLGKKIIVLVLGIFVVFFLITLLLLFNSLLKPFRQLPGDFSNREKIDLTFRTNLLLINYRPEALKEIAILSLSSADKESLLLRLDPNTLVAASKGGSFQTIFLNQGHLSIDKLKASVLASTGVNIDGYLAFNSGEKWFTQENLQKLNDFIYSPSFFLDLSKEKKYLDQTLSSEITLIGINQLLGELKIIGIRNQEYFDFTANKNEKGFFDKSNLETKIGLLLQDSLIAKEGDIVEVDNASSTPDLGGIYSVILSNMGASVLDTAEVAEAKTTRIYTKNKNSSLAKKLSLMFGIKIEDFPLDQSSGLDVKLVLGQDTGKYFKF